MISLVWFRDDLRISDNPALTAAAQRGKVVALYVLDEVSEGVRPLGAASKWWLHESLKSLSADLAALGVTLLLRRGPAAEIAPEVAVQTGAGAVFWNRRYGGGEREIDSLLKTQLRGQGLEVSSFAASLLFEPWTIRTGSDTPYGVFTPFWKSCLSSEPPRQPLTAPTVIGAHVTAASDSLAEWELQPTRPDWAGGLHSSWTPGEAGAHARLQHFLANGLSDYSEGRDFTDREATSRLSPHLRWGEISPYQVWHAAQAHGREHPKHVAKFLAEVGWREFAWHVYFHFPRLASDNWKSDFDAFPWKDSPEALGAWQRGETGIDLVDAGMRELWQTGYMHNRVRMVAASLLIKNLLVDWRLGEQWFWDTLVDADQASNPFGWQWVAGSGADAAPYFRIFNPEIQAAKFDPQRVYRDRWLGHELRPAPIVDVGQSRAVALAAYEKVSEAKAAREQ